MTRKSQYRGALVVIGLGALLLTASVTVPVVAKKKNAPKAQTKVIESAPLVFGENQGTASGSYRHQVIDASCPRGFRAIGWGSKFSPDRGAVDTGGEYATAYFVGTGTVHFRAGVDIDNNDPANGPSTFTGQVVCRKG